MELQVHTSTSGHLLAACSLEVVAVSTQTIDVHVIMATLPPHLSLWAMTIFVRVHDQKVIGELTSSILMLHSGMARFVRVVVHVASSTVHHGSPRT